MLRVVAGEQSATPAEMDAIVAGLDERAGVILASGVEYPGRYTRWDIGFIDPPLSLEGRGFELRMRALNDRGRVPLACFTDALEAADGIEVERVDETDTRIRVASQRDELLPEEQRTRRRSSFTVLRVILEQLPKDSGRHFGLYGAFGYDLVRQIETLAEPAGGEQRDLAVYLPDSILAVDRQRGDARRYDFDFAYEGASTVGVARDETVSPFTAAPASAEASRDHEPGEYAALVREAKHSFARGDLFEVVPGQAFRRPVRTSPAQVFRNLVRDNPAPYGALMNLGDNEFLVTASPEMFVRVQGSRVETAPISGTIARGADAIEDADRIRTLLNSDKDASELTMCTDVDRNDKSRICEPDSIRIIGRRQVELYSKVIHTVDHVEGTLREGFDGLDAIATHMWAVTVTGAPKIWAMRFIDEHERSPRTWRREHRPDESRRDDPRGHRRGARGRHAAHRLDAGRRRARDRDEGAGAARGDCLGPGCAGRGSCRGRAGRGERRGAPHPHVRSRRLVRADARRLPARDRRRGAHGARAARRAAGCRHSGRPRRRRPEPRRDVARPRQPARL
jgi:anthranilate synthase